MVTKMFEDCRSIFQRKKMLNLPPKTFSVFFIGEFSPNFDLENMISTSASDFSWKEIAQIWQIWKRKKNLKSPKLYDKFYF
jgi:hypothetical protein